MTTSEADQRGHPILSAAAVRERCGALFERVEAGRSAHLRYEPSALAPIVERVAALTKERFPDGDVPLHARWRHFEVGGHDRFASLAAARNWSTPADAARAMGDLAIVSVLLDAGAGPSWHYDEAATGERYARSEGLALASLALFASGALSAVPADPLRADAQGLASLSLEDFERAFDVSEDNPLEGAEGRLSLLTRCADAVRSAPDLFASEDDPRPGGLIDALAGEAVGGTLPAPEILSFVLEALGAIWPSRLTDEDGVPLGDTWRHPDVGLVPFHKLSTWLSLSLIEPLEVAGVTVTELDRLPGLAEYRNGGLFIDGGALVLKAPPSGPVAPDDPLVIEWRAATVALLSRLAPMVNERLGTRLPLPAILEGGTWLAGRLMARERRADGGPPIALASDGTVF